jgi:hypothetical protein
MAGRLLLPLAVLLTACSTVYTREDDAGMDAFVEDDDAWAPDAYSRWGWWPMDANSDVTPDSSEPDAFTPEPDAWELDVPPDAYELPDAYIQETCDGVDEDADFSVDEGAVCAGGIPCWEGRCHCYDSEFDCSPEPGCETPEWRTCGGCDSICGVMEQCLSEDGAPPRCVPMQIRDLTAATNESGPTCVIRLYGDSHLFCRGLNTDHAISDVFPETATLDWTDMGLPYANHVRAWGHLRADGIPTMTICAITSELLCRGSNETGLLMGDEVPTLPGWHRVPVTVPSQAQLSIEGGEGILLQGSEIDRSVGGGVVWGGPNTGGRIRTIAAPGRVGGWLGDGARRFLMEREFPNRLYTWGAPVPGLSVIAWRPDSSDMLVPWDDTSWPGLGRGSRPNALVCDHGYCCLESDFPVRVQCWGGGGFRPEYVDLNLSSVPLADAYGSLTVFPSPTGTRACLGQYCLPLATLHDGMDGRTPILDPTILLRGQSRTDWRARCAWDDTAWRFTCTGMHTGWPEP